MTSGLTQYINPIVEGKARQALRAHRAVSGIDSYKTVMCQTWLETAGCGFGPNCKFAHGEQELRPCRFPPPTFNLQKYKTKLCEKYTTRGICPYGRRCLFIHPDVAPSEDDADGMLSLPPAITAPVVNSPVGPASSAETTSSTKTGGGSGGDGSSGGGCGYYRQPMPLFIPPPQVPQHHQEHQSHPQRHHSMSAVPTPKVLTTAASWPYFLDEGKGFNDGATLAEDQGYGDSGDGELFPSRKGRNAFIGGGGGGGRADFNGGLPPSHSRLSIWSSHEDVFAEGEINDSGHSLKDLRETLAFSLSNVLDLSDVRL